MLLRLFKIVQEFFITMLSIKMGLISNAYKTPQTYPLNQYPAFSLLFTQPGLCTYRGRLTLGGASSVEGLICRGRKETLSTRLGL
jgi:hypothetical protein